jgi:hypothetical protein
MARALIGRPAQGLPMHVVLTTRQDHKAKEDAINASLDQSWNHIIVLSPFGTMSFHREDQEVVTQGLRNLADFIERTVVK